MDNSLKKEQFDTPATVNCAKCLSLIKGKVVWDIDGRCFCSRFCLNEWWAEQRKLSEEVYNWWKGE